MTKFRRATVSVGNEHDGEVPEVVIDFYVGMILITEGFWLYCKSHASVRDPYVFNGPFESGRIERDELPAFIEATRTWSRQYEGDGLVHGVYSGTPKRPQGEAEVTYLELQQG